MGLLESYRKKEAERINRLYVMIDMLTVEQIHFLIERLWYKYFETSPGAIKDVLLLKMSRILNFDIGKNRKFLEWYMRFLDLELEIKKSFLVTIANDICRLSVGDEAVIMKYIEDEVFRISRVTSGRVNDKGKLGQQQQ